MSEGDGEEIMVVQGESVALAPVIDLAEAKARMAVLQKFVQEYLVAGEDFGVIPGTVKPTLYKSGSDKLCDIYGMSDEYEVINRVEDWDRSPHLFDYEIRCTLRRKKDGALVSTGLGSCNSYEGKYRWRESKRICPDCGKETIIKGKEEYGGGWVCFAKKGGCSAKFPDNDETITSQQLGKIENDDVATLKNTILKMAKKRAKVDATLAATRSSGIFTQDVEDMGASAQTPSTKPESGPPLPQRSSATEEPTDPNLITEKQKKRLFAIAKKSGVSNEILKSFIMARGFNSSAEITRDAYEEICNKVELGQEAVDEEIPF